ncbi:unnamed protein product, partial [Didymodactylos carnosus]
MSSLKEEQEEEFSLSSIPLPKFRLDNENEIPNKSKDLLLNSNHRMDDEDEQIFLTGTTAMPYNYRPNRVRRSACSDLQSTTIPENRVYNDQYDNNRRRLSLFTSPSVHSSPPIHTSSSSLTIDDNDNNNDYVNSCRKRCQSFYGRTKSPNENLVRQSSLPYTITTSTTRDLEPQITHNNTGEIIDSYSHLMPQNFSRRHSHCITAITYNNENVTDDPYISSTSLVVKPIIDNDDYSRSSSCFDVNKEQTRRTFLFQPKSKKKSCSDTNILHQTRHSLPCENSNTSLAIKNFLKRHHLSSSKTPTTSSSSLVSSTNSLSSSSSPINSTFQNFKHLLTLVKLPKQQRSSVSSSTSSTASATPTYSSSQTLTSGGGQTTTSLSHITTQDVENESTISKNAQKKSTTKLKMCDCEWHYQHDKGNWCSINGSVITLGPIELHNLTYIEHKLLKRIIQQRLQNLDMGLTIHIPK